MSVDTVVIANPASGGGSSPERLARLEEELRERLGPLEFVQTTGRGAASELAVKAVRAGASRVIVAGGDGTLGEVVDGLLGAELGSKAAIGLLPLGRGCDFARTVGVSRDLGRAIDSLVGGAERWLDAGSIALGEDSESSRPRYFLNVASAGISADVVHNMNLPHVPGASLGPTPAFAIAAVRAIASHTPAEVRVSVDGEVLSEGRLALLAVGNGCYFGAGMSVAPGASPTDGLFEVVSIDAMSPLRLIANFGSIYRGTHTTRPYVHVARGERVVVEVLAGTLKIEADGEERGIGPARFEVLPRAIRFIGGEV